MAKNSTASGTGQSRVTAEGMTAAQITSAIATGVLPASMKLSARPGNYIDPSLLYMYQLFENLDAQSHRI
jgi:hypothetical protein